MRRRPAPNEKSFSVSGPYRGPAGVWRYDITRNGVSRWGSLHTKDEAKAQQKLLEIYDRCKRANDEQ